MLELYNKPNVSNSGWEEGQAGLGHLAGPQGGLAGLGGVGRSAGRGCCPVGEGGEPNQVWEGVGMGIVQPQG